MTEFFLSDTCCLTPVTSQLHATCVSINGKGVLLLGPSGSGKSDLALRLIDGGAVLVADDRVDVSLASPSPASAGEGRGGGLSTNSKQVAPPSLTLPREGRERGLFAAAPENLRGMLEMRGVGIVRLPYSESVPLSLAVELVAPGKVERLPEPQVWDCLGARLPLLSLHAFDASACAKIRMVLK